VEGTEALLKTNRGKRRWSHIIQAAMRPVMIVIHSPPIYNISQFSNAQEQFSIEKRPSEASCGRRMDDLT